MLISMGTFDVEDGLRLPCGRLLTLVPSVILVLGVTATLLRLVVLHHCCHHHHGGGVSVLC